MKYEINPTYKSMEEYLVNIQSYFSNNDETIHKARNELKIITYKKMKTIVKSFKVPHKLNQVVYSFFRNSKAKKSYENSLKIQPFAPKPIGYIEFYQNNLLSQSYFISEAFEYDFTIREPLLDVNFQDRENIFHAFAHFTYKLHQAGIFHDDYSPGNILIKKTKQDYEFKIVDVNRMQFAQLSKEQRAKNFSKLWAKNSDLETIGKHYIEVSKDEKSFITMICNASDNNKKIKNFKKKLKGKEIDW